MVTRSAVMIATFLFYYLVLFVQAISFVCVCVCVFFASCRRKLTSTFLIYYKEAFRVGVTDHGSILLWSKWIIRHSNGGWFVVDYGRPRTNAEEFCFFSTFYHRKLSGIGNIDPAFGFWVGRVWRRSVFLRSFLKYDILCSGSIFVVDFIMCQRRQSFWFHSPYKVYTYPMFAAVGFPISLVPRDNEF